MKEPSLEPPKAGAFPVCDILGLPYFGGSAASAIEIALEKMEKRETFTVFTPGATVAARAAKDESLAALLRTADMLLPDGSGTLLAARLCGGALCERIAGIDFAEALFALSEGMAPRIFFYGARQGVAERAAANLRRQYPGIVFACADGYGDDPALRIARFQPHAVCVCLGAEKQERWIAAHKDAVGGVCIGLGGSFDVFAGVVPRAPRLWQKAGLEWAYRTLREPKRIPRLFPLPAYYAKCLRARWAKRPKPTRK